MTDERALVAALRASTAVAVVDRLVRSFETALGTSNSARLIAAVRRRFSSSMRQVQVGAVLALAASVHVAAMLLTDHATGWLWLLVPAVVFAAGVLLLASGRAMARQESHTRA
jgi:hypothetical protein